MRRRSSTAMTNTQPTLSPAQSQTANREHRQKLRADQSPAVRSSPRQYATGHRAREPPRRSRIRSPLVLTAFLSLGKLPNRFSPMLCSPTARTICVAIQGEAPPLAAHTSDAHMLDALPTLVHRHHRRQHLTSERTICGCTVDRAAEECQSGNLPICTRLGRTFRGKRASHPHSGYPCLLGSPVGA